MARARHQFVAMPPKSNWDWNNRNHESPHQPDKKRNPTLLPPNHMRLSQPVAVSAGGCFSLAVSAGSADAMMTTMTMTMITMAAAVILLAFFCDGLAEPVKRILAANGAGTHGVHPHELRVFQPELGGCFSRLSPAVLRGLARWTARLNTSRVSNVGWPPSRGRIWSSSIFRRIFQCSFLQCSIGPPSAK